MLAPATIGAASTSSKSPNFLSSRSTATSFSRAENEQVEYTRTPPGFSESYQRTRSLRRRESPCLELEAHDQGPGIGEAPTRRVSMARRRPNQGIPAIDRLMDKYPNIYGEFSAGSGANSLRRDRAFGREFLVRQLFELAQVVGVLFSDPFSTEPQDFIDQRIALRLRKMLIA